MGRTATAEFQSTLSVRRATRGMSAVAFDCMISIHALREESDLKDNTAIKPLLISIHALREESDISIGI